MTDHDQTTLTDLMDDEAAPVAREETTSSTTDDDQPPTRSTLIEPPENPALDMWIAERTAADDPYGYCHLYLLAHSDLNGSTYDLRYETQIDLGTASETCTEMYNTESWGGVTVDTVCDELIDWLLTTLETPYHEELRPIPVDHLRVFVTDTACEYLTEHDIAIDSLCEQLHDLPEHHPSQEYLANHRTLTALIQWLKGDEGLHTHERRIEATIRARLDFNGRYIPRVPDPAPAYEPYSLTELEIFLTTVREQIEQTKQRSAELTTALAAGKTDWREQIRSTHFD